MSRSITIPERIALAERGENPTVICRMASGYLSLCDIQTPRGWCVLTSVPLVHDLDDLRIEQRVQFLTDLARAGEALKRVLGAYRMNYSILGNTDPWLHAHLQPRFADEPPEQKSQPIWSFGKQLPQVAFDPQRDAELMERIRAQVARLA
jgi:diadenosine tetraphosphate (Ap4A) HIT family hydrolase